MNPPVQILENFISSENCKYLIETYKDKVFQSKVVTVDKDGNSKSDLHTSRTSSTYYIPNTDKVVTEIRQKVSTFLGVNINNIEGIQFLRYMKGEKYLWHHDFLKGADVTNQRTDTLIIYLNTLKESDGGATSFFHYNMKVHPKEGRAAWFKNCDENGQLINESLHAGEEILTDVTKYALNIWIRQKSL